MAEVAVILKARTAQFTRGMFSAKRVLRDFENAATKVGQQIGKIGNKLSIVGGVGFAGLSFALKKTASEMDALSKQSRQLNVGTKDFTRLQAAAELSGTSIEAVGKGIKKLQRSISEAGQLKTAERLFKALDIDVGDIRGKSSFGQLIAVGDALGKVSNQADKLRIASELFGRSAQDMLTLLENGGDGLREMGRIADKAGFSFNQVAGRSIEAANDAITRLGFVLRGQFRQAVIQLAPIVSNLADALFNAATDGDILGKVLAKSTGIISTTAFAFRLAIDDLAISFLKFLTLLDNLQIGILQLVKSVPDRFKRNRLMPHNEEGVKEGDFTPIDNVDTGIAGKIATLVDGINKRDALILKTIEENKVSGEGERLFRLLEKLTVGAPVRGIRATSNADTNAFDTETRPSISKFLSFDKFRPEPGGSIGFRQLNASDLSLATSGAAIGMQKLDFEREQAKALNDLVTLFKTGKARIAAVSLGGISVPLLVTD